MLGSLLFSSEPRSRALRAATLGYLLDAMDVLLYVFAVQAIRTEFHLTNAEAGIVSSFTLVASALGGIVAGMLSDRFGRTRVLIWTVLLYSLASAGSATSSGLGSLLFWRSLVGLGLGGEWSAGATLVAESWPGEHRAKAVGIMQSGWALGYMLAAAVTGYVLPRWGWRVLFLAGVLPALLAVYIRRRVEEPNVFLLKRTRGKITAIFKKPLAGTTWRAASVATATMLGYWGLFTWLPGFLSASRAEGGAGLDITRTSAWVFLMQSGAFLGYVSFGWLADRFGRRPVFAAYVLTAATLIPIYARSEGVALLMLGPLVGFAGSGYFSIFGAMLAELYPTEVRGTGQGFTYNIGRLMGALAPFAIGAVADAQGIGAALAINSAFFIAAAALIYALPETRHRPL